MKIPVYKGYDKFQQVGTLTISYNRITHVDISYSFPTPIGTAEKYALYITQGKEPPTTKRSLNQETQYPFTIKKLSRADFAYRKANLTHEIISNDLFKYFDTKFFIRLSFVQRQILAFNLKKFLWQTQDFKNDIYKYLATSLISAGIGVAGTLIAIKPCDKTNSPNTQTQTQQSNDTLTHQATRKTMKSLNVYSSYIDTAQQKDTTH
jgi:hypothetical protein